MHFLVKRLELQEWQIRLLLLGFGGLGAWSRYAVGLLLHGVTVPFPLATWVCNMIGSFLLGLLRMQAGTSSRWSHPSIQRLIGTGYLGAFTTFSAFGLESWNIVQSEGIWIAGSYVLSSLGVGMSLVWVVNRVR